MGVSGELLAFPPMPFCCYNCALSIVVYYLLLLSFLTVLQGLNFRLMEEPAEADAVAAGEKTLP